MNTSNQYQFDIGKATAGDICFPFILALVRYWNQLSNYNSKRNRSISTEGRSKLKNPEQDKFRRNWSQH